VKVAHSQGAYEISFLGLSEAFAAVPDGSHIITDEHVKALYGHLFAGEKCISVAAGEQSKSISTFESCLEALARAGATRKSSVVGFGGGVIGDLAGFVAASYMRGVAFIQIPTTLLAQVDSSVGGKVGIDLKAGKNLAGAFYPPKAVYVCAEVLQTLDQRQFNNGMAEVWKYGFIADKDLFDRLTNGASWHARSTQLQEVVKLCLQIKARIVEEDEFEEKGIRASLNFGHTVGHAIEHLCGFKGILHGEAISVGMVAEALLGERLGITELGTREKVAGSLASQGLPTKWDQKWDVPKAVEAMMRDKKRISDGLAFSLLTHIGECKLITGVSCEAVEQVLGSL
jgi:3-dehydroquinate synthase